MFGSRRHRRPGAAASACESRRVGPVRTGLAGGMLPLRRRTSVHRWPERCLETARLQNPSLSRCRARFPGPVGQEQSCHLSRRLWCPRKCVKCNGCLRNNCPFCGLTLSANTLVTELPEKTVHSLCNHSSGMISQESFFISGLFSSAMSMVKSLKKRKFETRFILISLSCLLFSKFNVETNSRANLCLMSAKNQA